MAERSSERSMVKPIAIVVFGFLAPLLLLLQAAFGLYTLTQTLSSIDSRPSAVTMLTKLRPQLHDVNDYIMSSHLIAESANQIVMTNKQIMKSVVMQVGFAVSSVGLMLVLLGITDGGAEGSFKHALGSVDFKTSSTGAIVFVTGAAMVAAGGLMRNEYATMGVPTYAAPSNSYAFDPTETMNMLGRAIDSCLQNEKVQQGECIKSYYGDIRKAREI